LEITEEGPSRDSCRFRDLFNGHIVRTAFKEQLERRPLYTQSDGRVSAKPMRVRRLERSSGRLAGIGCIQRSPFDRAPSYSLFLFKASSYSTQLGTQCQYDAVTETLMPPGSGGKVRLRAP
jgi:hypothetical protein